MKNFVERQIVRLLLSRGGPIVQKAVTALAAASVTHLTTKLGVDVAALGLNEAVLVGLIWAILDIAVTKLPANIIKDYGKQIQQLVNQHTKLQPIKVDGFVGPITVDAVATEIQ